MIAITQLRSKHSDRLEVAALQPRVYRIKLAAAAVTSAVITGWGLSHC